MDNRINWLIVIYKFVERRDNVQEADFQSVFLALE